MASADAVLPYVYPASRSLSELLPEAAAAADVTVIRTTSTLLSSVLQDSAIFSNGKTDLILVTIDPSEDLDGVVGSTKGLLEERDTHAYVLLVASDAGGEGCGRRRLVAESISVRRAQEIVTVRTIKMTPCILAGLLFFFFFLFLLWVGLGCLGAISYPKEFIHPEQQPALGREY
ncbi:hypothetical protein JKP88DRAFT_234584 [Tribonema minus]|uniref:Uncharacterized protein n=1 Tax=Tribonema minus TaxID=303371 RepID=A0A835ZFV1_9STRA|nr:hypothetical protein JKP88DRAFT_234584 [Tribonema minus]